MGESSKFQKPELKKFKSKIFHYAYKITISCLNGQLPLDTREAIIICLIQYFEADFLWKVNLKILNSVIILKISPMYSFCTCMPKLSEHFVRFIVVTAELILTRLTEE